MTHYRLPLLSRIADWVQYWLIPDRVHALIWLNALDDLENHMREVDHHDANGSRERFSAVSAVRIENIRRKLLRENLKATVGE